MRTRMVRVRRRPKGMIWAVAFLALSMALYIRVSVPALRDMQAEADDAPEKGERVTREITIGGLEIHLVSFGGYELRNEAKVEAARYVSRGAAGYVLDSDRLYVIGAGYEEREAAEKVCVQLMASEGMSCAVVSLNAAPVSMRMTAGSEQIEAFLAAEELLRDTAIALGHLAVSIDRGDATAKQAAEVVRTHLTKTEAAQNRLDALQGGTKQPLFEQISELLGDMAGQMEEMLKETKAMALSSRLKYCHVDIMVREIELMNGLGQKKGLQIGGNWHTMYI